MYKRTLRWISTLLALTIILQLSPTAFLSSLAQSAEASGSATSTGQYEYDAPQTVSDTIIANIPNTFTDETTTDILGRIEAPAMTQNDSRYLDIVSGYSLYSSLSETDAAFLCEYTGVASSDFTLMEQNGLFISDSVVYADLAEAFGYEVSVIISAAPTSEEASHLMTQISLYNNIVDPELDVGTDTLLRNQIFQGYTCEQVLNAYGVSQIHSIDSGTLLSGGNDLSSVDLPENELTQINTFSNSLGISSTAIANHVTQNNVATSDVVSSGAQVESAIAGIISSSYPAGSASGSAGEFAVFPENITAPYLYSHSDSEQVILNSGALVYENVDYILPGVNGLDLKIARRYNSHSANLYSPIVREAEYPVCVYFVVMTVVAYYSTTDGDFGRWSDYDFVEYIGPYSMRSEAKKVSESCTGAVTYEDHLDGKDLIFIAVGQILPAVVNYVWYSVTDKVDNNYFDNLYGLGQGWSLQFSSVQISDNAEFLYLSDGSTYEVDWSANNPSHLKGYTQADKIFERNITEFSSGDVNSQYRLTYQDGKREYFSSDGKLIGICDRYGNSIKFEHSTLNGYPYIIITDTLNRITIISGTATDTGHVMSVTLPDERQIIYNVAQYADNNDVLALSSVTDSIGQTTSYGYTLKTAGFDTVNKNTYGGTNTLVNLTTITHPTGVQTIYSYEIDKSNLGEAGLTEAYRLVSRVDSCGDVLSNEINYSYSDCDNTGYPTYSDSESLPSTFTYSATVTDSLGNTTTTVFNKDHLAVSSTVTNGDTTVQSVHYEYTNKLPTKTTTRLYNASGDYIESIEAAEYDSCGNVTAHWSSYAVGDITNTEYKTTYTYDPNYGIPLTQTYKSNPDTTIRIENTLDSTGKNVASTKLYINDIVAQRTDYTHDTFGNILQQKRFHDNMTDYVLTEYTYQDGAYLTQEKHTGILSADGSAATGTPGQAAGTIITTHTYDSMGRRLSTTDGNGNTTSYTYDASGNVTQITNPDNTTVTYTRDYANNRVTVTDENGAQVTYTYTPLGLEYETVDTLTNKVINRREYDAQSRLVKYYDYIYGAVTEYTYDNLDRVTSETVYQGDVVLAQTTYSYDDAAEDGLYQKVTKTIVGDANAPSIVTTQYTDKHGNVVKTGKFLNDVEYFDTSTYDYVGNVLTTLTAADEQKNLDYTARYVYNGTNQVVSAYNALGQSTTNTYNALGQLVSTTDYAGTPTTYTYDALGRLLTQTITIEDGVTATNKYDYDPAGNIIREYKPTNAVGSAATWAKTEYTYDSRQRLTAVAQYQGDTVASVTRYTYDGAGNILTMTTGLSSLTDTAGSTTTYTYDRFGNVLTTTDALGKVETNTYTDLGRLSSTVDRNGVTTSYTYDALGRILTTIAGEDELTYTYTKTGQVWSELCSGFRTEYTYDGLGQVKTIRESSSESALVTYTLKLDPTAGVLPRGVQSEIEFLAGDYIVLPTPTRTGCTFMGWYLGDTAY